MDENIPLIVSIESRKGGVGKTTAALCLARILREEGYATLLLDLDVTGTNATDIANSPFWKQTLHVIDGDKNEFTEGTINFIELFEKYFMSGKPIPDFSIENNASKHMYVDLSKVNVLGSNVYNTSIGGKPMSIERPCILFDDLHTIWLLELIKRLIDNFMRVSVKGQFFKFAIVLDNSPGYVGIAPAIHEWLTDCGPEYNKFMTVTSLDEQDLVACGKAIDALHELYKSKWDIGKLFVDASKENGETKVKKEQETFFMRLATSGKDSMGSQTSLAFYKKENIIKEKGQIFYYDPSKYISVVINRVPKEIKTGSIIYDLPESMDGAINYLLHNNYKNREWRDYIVCYDEYIEYQFILQHLQRNERRYRDTKYYQLIENLNIAEQEFFEYKNIDNHSLEMFEPPNLKKLKFQLTNADGVLNHARATVADAGFGRLAKLIRDEWLPGYIIPSFRTALTEVMRESDYPYFDMYPSTWLYEGDSFNSEIKNYVNKFKRAVQKELNNISKQEIELRKDSINDTLAMLLSGLVGLSATLYSRNSPQTKEISSLFALVLYYEIKHWNEKLEKNRKFSIQQFLAQETVSINEFNMESKILESIRFLRHTRKEHNRFILFYKACTSAQARLIDFISDTKFILQLLIFILKREKEGESLVPYIRGIAEDVIIKKSTSHEQSKRNLSEALQSLEYFKEFDSTLKKILLNWGLK